MPQAHRIAVQFCRILRRWLSADEMAEVIARNCVEPDAGICHSHDFCDANEAMAEAFGLSGVPLDLASEADLTLWGMAWNIAADSGFTARSTDASE